MGGCIIFDKISGGMEYVNYKSGEMISHRISPPHFNHCLEHSCDYQHMCDVRIWLIAGLKKKVSAANARCALDQDVMMITKTVYYSTNTTGTNPSLNLRRPTTDTCFNSICFYAACNYVKGAAAVLNLMTNNQIFLQESTKTIVKWLLFYG